MGERLICILLALTFAVGCPNRKPVQPTPPPPPVIEAPAPPAPKPKPKPKPIKPFKTGDMVIYYCEPMTDKPDGPCACRSPHGTISPKGGQPHQEIRCEKEGK